MKKQRTGTFRSGHQDLYNSTSYMTASKLNMGLSIKPVEILLENQKVLRHFINTLQFNRMYRVVFFVSVQCFDPISFLDKSPTCAPKSIGQDSNIVDSSPS